MTNGILKKDKAVLVVVDVQESFRPVISQWEGMLVNITKLIKGCQILEVPIIITQQYTQGLGETAHEIKTILNFEPVEKLSFSCFGEEMFKKQLKTLNRSQIVLCGIESHICVLNTVLDAIESGYETHCVVDSTSSRKQSDKEIAMNRVMQSGAYLASTEMVLFQLLKTAGNQELKRINKLVK